MSSLGEIRAKVEQQKSINNQLRNEISILFSGVSNANQKWGQVCNYVNGTLQTGEKRIEDSHELTLRSYEIQCDIEKMYALFKNIEFANKKIRECKNKIYYEFANYNAVRKIVQALLNNIEVAFVSDKTLTKAVEVKHLQLPDYWLTCAILSIMAWRNDDKELAQKALERAYKLDKRCTCIFFFAFHVRIGMDSVAIKWFEDYVTCSKHGEDQQTLLLMFAIAGGTIKEKCSAELLSVMNKYINQFIDSDVKRNGYSQDEIVERIRLHLKSFKSYEAVNYPVLSNYCKEMNYIVDELMAAKVNINILDFIRKTVNVTNHEKNNFLNQYIDELIGASNKSEKDVADQIRYNELIIEKQGDIESAKAAYAEWKTHRDSELQTISEMVNWVFASDLKSSNPVVVKAMFKIIKQFTNEAFNRNVNEYRSRFKRVYNIKIGDYETQANLANEAQEAEKIQKFYEEKAALLISQQKIWPSFIGFGIAVLAIVGTIALANPTFLVGAVGGVLGGVLKILLTNRNKKRIKKDSDMQASSAKNILSQIVVDFANYEKEYLEYDSYANEIIDELEKL